MLFIFCVALWFSLVLPRGFCCLVLFLVLMFFFFVVVVFRFLVLISIVINSLGVRRAYLYDSHVSLHLMCMLPFCRVSLRLGVRGWLRV